MASPKNPVIEESLSAMITPYIVSKMRQNQSEEILKLLNSNVESPYLVWDNGTRAELTDFLENERTNSVRRGTCDPHFGSEFKFSAHKDELVVGMYYIQGVLRWIGDILKSYYGFVFGARHFSSSFVLWKNV